ncbi:MAG: choice-of-anchor J domain-containing protein, partial [Muribaculaceae bacterium]|nr:choice-of-anchor J domain-containing protein [Muribaculaceae bacterium]
RIYELTENADGSLTSGDTYVDNVTVSTTGEQTIASSELDPNKIYQVLVAGARSFYYEVSFKTPLTNRPGVPTIVSAEPTATTSEVTWTSGENNDSWNLRYRPYVETTTETMLWDFENSSLGNWTTIDADGDGYNWVLGSAVGGVYLQAGASLSGSGHSATDLVASGSYSNVTGVGALSPDNYLVSPKVKLGGSISFWAKGQDASYPAEVFGVAVSTNSNTNVADFRMVGADKTATSDWVQYTFDLSAYAGQEGYVAIRHYNVSDMFMLDIDDIEITYFGGAEPSPWIYVNDVTSPYTIEGLTPETTYEVQVQGVNDISTSAWTASTLFTTLAVEGQDLAYIEEHGVPGTTYRVSNELVAVDYAIVGDVVYLWCKDQGNASIAPAPAVGDKIDYLRYDQYAQAGRAWDESNWVVLKFTPGSVAEKVKSITDAVGHELNAGTITGVYSDAVNYTITMPAGEGMPAGAVGDESSYTPNVYCVANFNPANLTADGAQSNENGNVYFFMTPKVQEVCEITYAYWDATNFIVPTTSGFVGSLSLNWAYNADGDVTDDLNADNVYRFKTVVQRTGITMTPALKAEGGNYKVAPLNLTSASKADIPTAIGTVKAGVDVVDVYYVNSIGVMSKTPFHGVNVVVTRYSDGSRSSVKKVFK